jgi:hypothetical protein
MDHVCEQTGAVYKDIAGPFFTQYASSPRTGNGSDHLETSYNYSMEQSLSWEANRFSGSQEIPNILWKPKVHYRIHKRPPPVPILSQLDPVKVSVQVRGLLYECFVTRYSFSVRSC